MFLVGLSIIYLNFSGIHTELVDSYSFGRYPNCGWWNARG